MKAGKLFSAILATAVLGFGVAVQAQSTVIFDSFLSSFGSHIVGVPAGSEENWMFAQSFKTGAENWTLESVTLSVSLFSETPRNGGFSVGLYGVSGIGLGPLLVTLVGDDNPSSGFNSYIGAFDLVPNTTYWVKAATVSPVTSAYAWDMTNYRVTVGSTSGMSYSSDGGSAWELSNNTMLLQVKAVPTTVPEPSALALAIMSGAALGALRRRKL